MGGRKVRREVHKAKRLAGAMKKMGALVNLTALRYEGRRPPRAPKYEKFEEPFLFKEKLEVRLTPNGGGRYGSGGLFTTCRLISGTPLIEYLGVVRDDASQALADALWERDAKATRGTLENVYRVALREGEYWIDARAEGNVSRYINHARETAGNAPGSANLSLFAVETTTGPRAYFRTLRDIKAGEELLFEYSDTCKWARPDHERVPRPRINYTELVENPRRSRRLEGRVRGEGE